MHFDLERNSNGTQGFVAEGNEERDNVDRVSNVNDNGNGNNNDNGNVNSNINGNSNGSGDNNGNPSADGKDIHEKNGSKKDSGNGSGYSLGNGSRRVNKNGNDDSKGIRNENGLDKSNIDCYNPKDKRNNKMDNNRDRNEPWVPGIPDEQHEDNTQNRYSPGFGLPTKDMEIRDLDANERNAEDHEESMTTATIFDKLHATENGSVLKPMLEASTSSKNRQEGRKLYQYLSTLLAGLMAMQSGMMLGWTSPILPYLSSKDSFIPDGLTESKESWVCSLLALGAVLGAVPAGKVADKIGRKAAITLSAVPFIISWLILIFLRNLPSMYVARFVGGIGAGAACVLVPVYIGEVAEASIRGALGSFFPLLFSLGIVFVYVTGAYATYTTFNVACCLTLLPFLGSVYFLPESPFWLVHKNRMKQAAKSLRVLRGEKYDPTYEITLLQIEADRVENRRGGIRDLIGTRAGRKALGTCVGLMWFQQMSGIDAVLFYTVSIFQDAGSTIEPYVATIIIGIIEVVMAILVASVIDKFGRKPLLVLSGTAMTICLGVLGYYFKLKAEGKDVLSIGWLPLTCLSLFNVVFSVGYGSVPFAVISELFPPETKGVASSISIMTNWILVFAVTKLFPTMVEFMGQAATFWTFGCMTAMSAVFAFVLVPETKGKTLQEIQTKLEFRKGSNSVKFQVKEVLSVDA